MKTTLTEAINSSNLLDAKFETLGKKKGFFGSRVYVSYDDQLGWSFCKLNCGQIFLRRFCGEYKNTQLLNVALRINLDLTAPPELKRRINELWDKTYPGMRSAFVEEEVKPTLSFSKASQVAEVTAQKKQSIVERFQDRLGAFKEAVYQMNEQLIKAAANKVEKENAPINHEIPEPQEVKQVNPETQQEHLYVKQDPVNGSFTIYTKKEERAKEAYIRKIKWIFFTVLKPKISSNHHEKLHTFYAFIIKKFDYERRPASPALLHRLEELKTHRDIVGDLKKILHS